MKFVAVFMMITGAIIGTGAALEFRYFGPGDKQFWVGAFTTPAAILFLVAGVGTVVAMWASHGKLFDIP